MIRTALWLALPAALWAVFSCPAQAQMVCSDFETTKETLGRLHQESSVGIGVTPGGNLIQLFRSRDGATWTLLRTLPNGLTCLIGVGGNWEALTPDEWKPETRTN